MRRRDGNVRRLGMEMVCIHSMRRREVIEREDMAGMAGLEDMRMTDTGDMSMNIIMVTRIGAIRDILAIRIIADIMTMIDIKRVLEGGE